MMNNPRDAFDILDRCRMMLSKSWVHQGNDAYNSSCLVYVLELLKYCTNKINIGRIPEHLRQGYTLEDQNAYCSKQAYEKHPEYGKKVIHKFKLGFYSNTWNVGPSGFVADYLYPQRWFAMREKVGMAFCMVDEKFYKHCIDRMLAYDWRFAWDKMLVVGYSPLVKETLTRGRLVLISREVANEYFDEYIDRLDMYGEIQNIRQNGVVRYNLVYMMGRLCSMVSEDRVMRYAKALMKFDIRIVGDILSYVYDFLSADELSMLMPIVLHNFEVGTPYKSGIQLPSNRKNLSFIIKPSIVEKIHEGLLSENVEEQAEAYELFVFLWARKELLEKDRVYLENSIRKWRATNESAIAHCSFNLLSATEKEMPRLNAMVQKTVDDFCAEKYVYMGSSDILSLCISNLEKVCIHEARLSEEQVSCVFNRIVDVIHDNLNSFLGDNENEIFFGGLRTFLDDIIRKVSGFVCKHCHDIVGNEYLGMFSHDLKAILDKGYRCLPMLVWFTSIKDTLLMSDEMNERLKKTLFSKDASMRNQTVSAILFAWKLDNDIRDILNHMFSVLKVIMDVRIVNCLVLIETLMLKGYDTDIDFSSKVSNLLTQIHDKINEYDLETDEKAEVCYHANFAAGIASVIYKEVQFPDSLEFPFFNLKESGFNDVFLGYERGKEEAICSQECETVG